MPSRLLAPSLLLAAYTASAAHVTFDVQPRLLHFGEPATATLTLRGTRHVPEFTLPDLPGIQVGATTKQTRFGTDGNQASLTWQLYFSRPGTNLIGPFSFSLAGKTYDLPAIPVVVSPTPIPPKGTTTNDLQLALAPPPSPAYPHVPIPLDLTLYSIPSLRIASDINLLGGIPDGLTLLQAIPSQLPTRLEHNGRIYNAQHFRLFLSAAAPGTYPCAPVIRFGVIPPNPPRAPRPFDFGFDFFDAHPPLTPCTLAAPTQTLTVHPLPTQNQPANFHDAIGSNFTFTASASPTNLTVGDPITLRLSLSGFGNIATIPIPSYSDTPQYKTYAPRQVGDAPDPSAIQGERHLEQVIIPKTDALSQLPPLQLPVFDVASGAYRTLTVGPFPLAVRPSPNSTNAMLLQIPGSDTASPGTLIRGEDIVYLKPPPKHFHPAPTRIPLPALLAAYLLPPAILAALAARQSRRRRLQGNVAFARRQKAPRAARAGLKAARSALAKNPLPIAVITPLNRAATDYFAHRLNLPPGAAEPPLILQHLAASGIDPQPLRQWHDFFDLVAQIRYAPSALPLTPDQLATWCNTLSSLLRAAEHLPLR